MTHPYNITPNNRENFCKKVMALDPTRQWEGILRERKSKRSQEQNDRYWSLLTAFGEYLGYDKDDMHELCRFKFLRQKVVIEGEALPIIRRTSKLKVDEMTAYMEAIERWAASLGFVWEGAAG